MKSTFTIFALVLVLALFAGAANALSTVGEFHFVNPEAAAANLGKEASKRWTGASQTALDTYVHTDDGYFRYWYSGVARAGNGFTAYMYNMTSQKWLDESFSNHPIWTHQVAVIIPHDVNLTLDSAFVYITGDSTPHNDSWPKVDDEGLLIASQMAIKAKSPGAVLYQVPNECIIFQKDPHGKPGHNCRTEDAAIAFTWWAFTNPEKIGQTKANPYWILEMPMAKAGVKVMDLLTQVVHTHTGGVQINGFYVAGASKRGWTTWLVGATGGTRVRGIMPIVLDALNVVAFAHRQFQFYGAWTFALTDYWHMNFTQDLDTPQTKAMFELVDPWYYRERLTMPKLAINAVGDEFQMPDDQRYWAHDMPGEMNIIMVKNAEHSMATGVLELMQSAGAFLESCQQGTKRPPYTWSINNATGEITVTTPVKPKKITVAYADSAEGVSHGRRDFRWAALNTSFCIIKVFGACVRPIIWTTTDHEYITQVDAQTWTAQMPIPTIGWRGFMLELQWDNDAGPDDFYFTSPVSVIPNTLPFPDCHGAACKSYLV